MRFFNFTQMLSLPYDIGYDNTLTFERLEKNSLDIVILGSSHAYYGFAPEVIDYNLNSNSFVYATPGATIEHSYYQLKNILKKQSPKIVVLELFTLADLRNDNVKLHKSIDTLPLNLDKINAINENIDPSDNDKLNFYFPLKLYHTEWKENSIMKKIGNRLKINYEKNITGFNFTSDVLDKEDKNVLSEKSVYSQVKNNLPPERVESIENIIRLCKDNDIKIVFTVTPYINQVDFPPVEIKKILNFLDQLIVDNNIIVVNYNELYEELNITKGDLFDEGQVNVFGAVKLSNYLSEYINKNNLMPKTNISKERLDYIKTRYDDFIVKYNESFALHFN